MPIVARATQRAVRSFVDWGVMADTETRGRYVAGDPCPVRVPVPVARLAEATLHVRDGAPVAPIQDLLGQPGLFPFRVSCTTARSLATESPRLDNGAPGAGYGGGDATGVPVTDHGLPVAGTRASPCGRTEVRPYCSSHHSNTSPKEAR